MNTSKIIKGAVSNGRYTVTAPIVKEDYGLYLQIEGVELPETYQVDFSNSENSGSSVTMIGNSDGVLIPRQFIDSGKDVFAFLYHVGQDFGRTVYKFRIPNKVRPDRTEDTPTPEEQSTIDQAINALNEAVEQTSQDKADADASAQSAKEDADRAEQAKDDAVTFAQRSANSAQASADYSASAQTSATASAQSASQSAQIKADVEDLAEDAQGYAQTSAQSASASANSASQAQGYAQSASASAQSASGYANNAQSYSQTASTKAQDASGYAQTASQKATESAQSASQALGYKTDAEGAKTASQTAQGLAESARDTAVSAKDDAEQAKADAESARDEAQQAVASISGALDGKADVITDTASGSIASFTDGADDLPLKSLVVSIEPKQDGTGDPSLDNVRPISGWTGMQLSRVGKNLYDASQPLLSGYLNSDGTVSGRSSSTNKHTYEIPIKGGATYTYSSLVPYTTSTRWCCAYDSEGTVVGAFGLNKNETSVTFTAPENAVSVSLTIFNTDGQVIQLEVGESATEKEDYIPETLIPISWQTEAGTVYGGKLDVLSGKMAVIKYAQDMSTLTWQTRYTGTTHKTLSTSLDYKYARIDATKIIAEKYPLNGTVTGVSALNNPDNRDVGLFAYANTNSASSSSLYCVIDVDGELPSGLVVYDITTPIEIQLTPHEVNSLLGVNNIFADTGDTTCEYRADTKLYINKKIAEAISALS